MGTSAPKVEKQVDPLIQEIKELVRQSDLSGALTKLETIEQYRYCARRLHNELNHIEKRFSNAEITYDDYKVKTDKIQRSILDLLSGRTKPLCLLLQPIYIVYIGRAAILISGVIILRLIIQNWPPGNTEFATPVPPTIISAPTLRPESTYTLTLGSGVELTFVHVPTGTFTMGSTEQQIQKAEALCTKIYSDANYCRNRFDNERPDHSVTLDAYWIMKTEVTNKQYKACVADAKACEKPENARWDNETYADHPVTNVTWAQADAYAQWVGRKLPTKAVGLRLPTEAEWELAARGTDGRLYPWGDSIPTDGAELLNFKPTLNDTTPVGSFPKGASPYGALDMAGNVTEWVADFYVDEYDPDLPSHNPRGPSNGIKRASRGGSYNSPASHVRATVRSPGDPTRPDYSSVGFRLAASDFSP